MHVLEVTTSVTVNSKRNICTLGWTLLLVLRFTFIAGRDPADTTVFFCGILPPPPGVANGRSGPCGANICTDTANRHLHTVYHDLTTLSMGMARSQRWMFLLREKVRPYDRSTYLNHISNPGDVTTYAEPGTPRELRRDMPRYKVQRSVIPVPACVAVRPWKHRHRSFLTNIQKSTLQVLSCLRRTTVAPLIARGKCHYYLYLRPME